jgi:anti-sigma regulatory factor (Ser/Thr protein kinase)
MGPGLRHNAFIYDSDDAYVARLAPFLQEGVEAGEACVAVVTRPQWAMLREALGGSAASEVSFTDRESFYVRPARAVARYEQTLRRLVGGGASSVRVIGEVQFGPTREEWEEWTAYEAILNHALAGWPAWIICPYDTQALPDQVLEHAWRTHPEVLNGEDAHSPHYDDPAQVVRAMVPDRGDLPELEPLDPGDDAEEFRERLGAELRVAGMSGPPALNLLIAAGEVIENAWTYGGGPRQVRVGLVGGSFVCEIEDSGPGLDDPLAGWRPPKPDKPGRAGLWVARQLTSRVDLLPSDEGLTVRLWS